MPPATRTRRSRSASPLRSPTPTVGDPVDQHLGPCRRHAQPGTLNGDGSYTLTSADLAGLTITPPANSDADFTLTVTATSTEASNGDTETTTDTVLVTVNAVADAPTLTSPNASGNEDTAIALSFSSALTDTDGRRPCRSTSRGPAGATLSRARSMATAATR